LFQLFSSNNNNNSYAQALKRRNVPLPLLDIDNDNDSIIIPLPAAHLPNELTTLQIYGTQLQSAIHKMMIDDAVSKVKPVTMDNLLGPRDAPPIYGHVVSKKQPDNDDSDSDSSSLIGAIGCAAEIVMATPSDALKIESITEEFEPLVSSSSDDDNSSMIGSGEAPMTVLAKGSFRFVVKEIKQTFPFPIAIVDELIDDVPIETGPLEYNDFEDKFDDDYDDDIYAKIDSSDLISRTLQAMKTIVDQKLSTKRKARTPLEEAILKDSGIITDSTTNNSMEQEQAEEMAALFQVFVGDLGDIAPTRIERLYAVAMMAAEFAGLGNAIRKEALTMTDGVARLRLVLEATEQRIGMVQAKTITDQILEKTSDSSEKDLKVGTPSLPPWARQIRKGTKVEYFWNEVEGWCKGEVSEDPVMVVDELIITVLFDDGTTVRLPFQGDEKARWRPGGM